MHSIVDLEAMPTKEIIRQGLQAKDFAWSIHDNEQILRLKYIYSEHDKLYKADKALVSNFAELSNYYTRTNKELLLLLEEEGLYFDQEESHILLVAICGFVFCASKTCLEYLGCKNWKREPLLSPENFCVLLGWQGLTYQWATMLYESYQGPRTEEILLTMEGLGFDQLLHQKLPDDILYFILCKTKTVEARWALRDTCRFLHRCKLPEIEPIPTKEESLKVEVRNVFQKPQVKYVIPISWSTPEEIARKYAISTEVLSALTSGDINLLQAEGKNIICRARFVPLIVHLMQSDYADKNESLTLLLEMFMQSVPTDKSNYNAIQIYQGKIAQLKKLRLAIEKSTMPKDFRQACLDILTL